MYAEALRLAENMDAKADASVARDTATPDPKRKAILRPETVKQLGLAQAFRKLVRRRKIHAWAAVLRRPLTVASLRLPPQALLVAPEAYSSQGAIFDVVGSQIAGDSELGSRLPEHAARMPLSTHRLLLRLLLLLRADVQLPVFPFTSYVESMAENAFHVLFKKVRRGCGAAGKKLLPVHLCLYFTRQERAAGGCLSASALACLLLFPTPLAPDLQPSNIAGPLTYRPGVPGGDAAYDAFRGVMGDDLKRGGASCAACCCLLPRAAAT